MGNNFICLFLLGLNGDGKIAEETSVIAIVALIISFFSICIGALSLFFQRVHDKKSVAPICQISTSSSNEEFIVILSNVGIGPMKITSFKVTDNSTLKEREHLRAFLPKESTGVGHLKFSRKIKGTAIGADKEKILLKYGYDHSNVRQKERYKEIKEILLNLTIDVEYEDIYGKKQDPYNYTYEKDMEEV
jgi:hypothetical protein